MGKVGIGRRVVIDELFVGASATDTDGGLDAGRVYLILGASLGRFSTIDHSDADYSFMGESERDYAGYSVSSAGDVDGDDLVVLILVGFVVLGVAFHLMSTAPPARGSLVLVLLWKEHAGPGAAGSGVGVGGCRGLVAW